jgi:hypothetical protein
MNFTLSSVSFLAQTVSYVAFSGLSAGLLDGRFYVYYACPECVLPKRLCHCGDAYE